MVDATELDFIRTLLSLICTGSTVKHIIEHGKNVHSIDDITKPKILVKLGELMSTSSNRYLKRFKVLVSSPSEILLITALNNLIDGIQKFQKRLEIADYTYEGTFTWIELVSGNEGKYEYKPPLYDIQLIIDAKFTTS